MTQKTSWKNFSANYASTSQEVKSHSSVLFNERLNAMFMMYDTEAIDLDIAPSIKKILRSKSLLATIWRNVRPLVSNNPNVRKILHLETEHNGIYTVDMGFSHIQQCITEMITLSNYAYMKLVYTVQQIQNVETIIREILQFYSYFIRSEYQQKPDINVASEKYRGMADEKTIDDFKAVMGVRSTIKEDLEMPVADTYFDDLANYLESPTAQDEDDINFANDKISEISSPLDLQKEKE